MTTLAVWQSFSETGERPDLPRAIYLTSDSRITWGSDMHRWDAGRKTFAPVKEPHLFGYVGDVLFPSLVLGQIVSAIDKGVLFAADAKDYERHDLILRALKASHRKGRNAPDRDFTIVHIFRANDWPDTSFTCWIIKYTAEDSHWMSQEVPLPKRTEPVLFLGSGAASARNELKRWKQSASGGTSRAIFSAFCDAIESGGDPLSGGVPQITGLYTTGAPTVIDFVDGTSMFLHGLELKAFARVSNIEWCDNLFQRIDPVSLKPLQGQRQFFKPNLE